MEQLVLNWYGWLSALTQGTAFRLQDATERVDPPLLAFCPTLFWLFFGLTVPLALRNTGGLAFPGLFAVGASLPLLAVTAIVGAGRATAGRLVGGLRRADRVLRVAAGTVIILAGLHDTIVYWLL